MTELLSALRVAAPGLEVSTDAGRRAQYAYDASNYRIPPAAVVFPRSAEEIAAVVRVCAENGVPVTSRGGGTGMAGNTVGSGVVLDCSRYFNKIVRIDPQARTAVVQPGVVLDDLRRAAAEHGLTFGPDPSSHSRCTLGGMIGNDACGNHSVRYGRTSEHVESLRVVLPDGRTAEADHRGLHGADDVADALRELVIEHLGEIRTELGRIPRQVSGYQLQHLLPENGFDVARALVGTEGTCVVVTEATVRLVPIAPAANLIALGYRDVAEAAEDVMTILEFAPASVEGIDAAIVDTMRYRRGAESVVGLPDGQAWLYVELDGDDAAEVAERSARLLERLRAGGRLVAGQIVDDPAARRSLWRVREEGAGLASRLVGGKASWPGWEDAAVAPENLAAYLREFQKLLTEHGYFGVLYGHFGAGCIHVRIDFDPSTAEGVAAMRRFLLDASRLVVRHGGTNSGEHGDGRARGELLSTMYSERILAAFAAMKKAFDPSNLFNPGVIVAPSPIDRHLALLDPPAPVRTAFGFPHDERGFASAPSRCVGVGKCRADSGGVMCPSYRATHDEKDSTRGRARVLQEMLRGGPVVSQGWRSKEPLEALDLCLSCKACSADCPVGVDMATYKAEFLHQHYKNRIRPRSHYSLGWLPLAAALATRAARPVNAVIKRALVKRAAGVARERSLPRFAGRRELRKVLRAAPTGDKAVLFLDTFTRAFRPGLAGATARVLASAGVPAQPRAGLCCGLTWVSTGQLGVARRVMARTVRALDGSDLPIIVPEPSCASALRTDAPELLGTDAARRVAARVTTVPVALAELAAPDWTPPPMPERVVLQTHCHEYATFPGVRQAQLLRGLGVRTVDEAPGCCGLAGNFGFEAEHYDVSMKVAALELAPRLASADGAPVLADGFSCRLQAGQLAPHNAAVHIAELIDNSIRAQQEERS
ncbi:FAD-binding and (Fe-S)-binding domain-containing protein [Labedaea rhizosphaerae]|uniref:FAD/FMN-containing dehydrogenase n=1 Tax=Labedaea rhizosphaerae TaxID=598644 RepID=A0A4R6S5T0_LABRH|nr:FAD-binding and (Fe-S)-binding domain-containing protein [Labedaea rhizosphaerae]TDP95122.1 FAD/FMN-containing dehydrogenase [Labedaea rhizosphaerae]